MKKKLTILLLVALLPTLAGCEKSDRAMVVDEQIAQIGEVTLESEAKITAAEQAVDALEKKEKRQLDNKQILEDARDLYNDLVVGKVSDAITAIGAVTLDSAESISTARKLYDESSNEIKKEVKNLAELEIAEKTLAELQITQVNELIAGLGEISLASGDIISTAKTAYDSLSEENKKKITDAARLEEASAQLKQMKKDQAWALMSVMDVENDQVRGVSYYSPKQMPYYADTRCYVLPYIGMNGENATLFTIYHYTADSWIFFEKITFAVDDKRYYKYFSRSEIVRDNDTEVWEYVNTANVTDDDIEMLWAIANSNQTIVRFEGDEYYHDFTVPAKDKQAIRDVLTAYEGLKS